ncbi:MAG: PliI family lysozyme inhibitor of I-type lysozyme, partial [Fluviibacter sp.]
MPKIHSLLIAACLTLACSFAAAADFEQTLELQGISFKVHATNKGSLNTLTIKPKGLKQDNKTISREINGTVLEAEVADMNADGSPEILVYTVSAGSGSYGGVVGYAANHKKSLTPIYLPELTDDKEASAGYMGHDKSGIDAQVVFRRP